MTDAEVVRVGLYVSMAVGLLVQMWRTRGTDEIYISKITVVYTMLT
jgi:hypothetical protein